MGIGCNEYNYTVTLRQSARSIAIIEDFTKKGIKNLLLVKSSLEYLKKDFLEFIMIKLFMMEKIQMVILMPFHGRVMQLHLQMKQKQEFMIVNLVDFWF
jgi:hypothetical protein